MSSLGFSQKLREYIERATRFLITVISPTAKFLVYLALVVAGIIYGWKIISTSDSNPWYILLPLGMFALAVFGLNDDIKHWKAGKNGVELDRYEVIK